MPGSIRVDTNTGETTLYTALVGRFDNQTVRRQRLDVGDVMLSAPSGTVVIERKSWADLAKSLIDKRYVEQKTRMLSFVAGAGQDDDDVEGGDSAPIAAVYIIEGALTGWHGKAVHLGGAPQMLNAQLEAAIVMMGVRDGIAVLRSKDKAHTTELVSYLFTKLHAGVLLSTSLAGGGARSYAGLVAKKRKRDNLTPETTWQVMLAQVPGMSANKAAAVAEVYPSMSALAAGSAKELADVMVPPANGGGGKARRLGPAVGQRLAALG